MKLLNNHPVIYTWENGVKENGVIKCVIDGRGESIAVISLPENDIPLSFALGNPDLCQVELLNKGDKQNDIIPQ